jgi:hypothetical protein
MDTSKSLAELSGTDWGPAPPAASELIRERHNYRRTPIRDLTEHGLIRLLNLGFDNDFLVPAAVRRLKDEPDSIKLLCAVLRADTFDWRATPPLVEEVREAVGAALSEVGQTTDDLDRLAA